MFIDIPIPASHRNEMRSLSMSKTLQKSLCVPRLWTNIVQSFGKSSGTSQNFSQNFPELPNFWEVLGSPRTFPRTSQNVCRTCPEFSQNLPERSQHFPQRSWNLSQNLSRTCREPARNLLRTRHATDSYSKMARTKRAAVYSSQGGFN